MIPRLSVGVLLLLAGIPSRICSLEQDPNQAPNQQGTNVGILSPDPELALTPHAWASFSSGQIVQGTTNFQSANNLIEHLWTEDAGVGFSVDGIYRERLRMVFGLNAKLYFSYPMFPKGFIVTKRMRQDFSFSDVYASYAIGDISAPLVQIQVGYFPFKYNPDVRNLGEYMFRSGTYPAYLIADFDFARARLLGFRSRADMPEPFKGLSLDFLLTTETYYYPPMDWNLSGLFSYDIANLHLVELGGGISFAHLISAYTNRYHDKLGNPTTPDAYDNKQYLDANGDTLEYTFTGTKAMGRIAIDPKALLKWDFLGARDLRVYAEACVIGYKNFPDSALGGAGKVWVPSYADRMERTPITFGINVPACKLLDILNVEMEWFGSKYLNDASNVMSAGSNPTPVTPDPRIVEETWKWSIYAKKSFFNQHCSITAQVARDHMRLSCAEYNFEIWQEMLPQHGDWWWVVKTGWAF
jgi:hypothetical protein